MIDLTIFKKIPITIIPIALLILYFILVFFHALTSSMEQNLTLVLSYLLFWCFEVDILRFLVFILLKLKTPKKLLIVFAIGSIVPYILNSVYWMIKFLDKSIDGSYLSFYLTDPLTPLYAGLIYTFIIFTFSFLDKRILNNWNVIGFVIYSFLLGSYIFGVAAIIFITSSLVFEIIIINILEWVKKFNLNKYLYGIIILIIIGVAISIVVFSAYIMGVLQMNVASNMFTQQIINNAGGTVDWSKLIK